MGKTVLRFSGSLSIGVTRICNHHHQQSFLFLSLTLFEYTSLPAMRSHSNDTQALTVAIFLQGRSEDVVVKGVENIDASTGNDLGSVSMRITPA